MLLKRRIKEIFAEELRYNHNHKILICILIFGKMMYFSL